MSDSKWNYEREHRGIEKVHDDGFIEFDSIIGRCSIVLPNVDDATGEFELITEVDEDDRVTKFEMRFTEYE